MRGGCVVCGNAWCVRGGVNDLPYSRLNVVVVSF